MMPASAFRPAVARRNASTRASNATKPTRSRPRARWVTRVHAMATARSSGVDPGCPTSCSGDGECDPGAHCDGACVDDSGGGAICDEDTDCLSGHCQNGHCCAFGDCCAVAGDCPGSYSAGSTCSDA